MEIPIVPTTWKSCAVLAGALLLLSGCGGSMDDLTGSDSGDSNTNNPGNDEANSATQLVVMATNATHSTGMQALLRRVGGMLGFSEALAVASGTDGASHAIDLTDFQVAIEKIKFRQEGEDDAELDDDANEPEFEGPFTLDLLDPAGPLAQTIGDVQVPAGVYDGIRFVMHKSGDIAATENLFDRSIYIAGTFDNGGPVNLVMWHDTGENFDLAGTNGFEVTEGQTGNDLIVDFKLQSLFTGIDLSTCTTPLDINPGTAETNCRAIADTLKENLKAAADFGKDDDDDGLDEDEDVDVD